MALVFDWLGIAEGSAADSRGALTLVGVGQNVIFATDFPHREQRVIVTTVVDESGEEVQENVQFDFEITVTSPSGRTLLGNRQVLTTGGATNPAAFAAGLPARGFQMVVGIGLEVMEYGIHPVSVRIGIPGAPTLSRIRNLYVVRPPILGALPLPGPAILVEEEPASSA